MRMDYLSLKREWHDRYSGNSNYLSCHHQCGDILYLWHRLEENQEVQMAHSRGCTSATCFALWQHRSFVRDENMASQNDAQENFSASNIKFGYQGRILRGQDFTATACVLSGLENTVRVFMRQTQGLTSYSSVLRVRCQRVDRTLSGRWQNSVNALTVTTPHDSGLSCPFRPCPWRASRKVIRQETSRQSGCVMINNVVLW